MMVTSPPPKKQSVPFLNTAFLHWGSTLCWKMSTIPNPFPVKPVQRSLASSHICLQEPCHGHRMAAPSCLIFCLNINRWVDISNFLCPSGCRGFICVREGFRIRASHWGSLQAICSGAVQIKLCSYLASSAVLHPTPKQTDLKKQQLSCSLLLLLGQNGCFPMRLNWLQGLLSSICFIFGPTLYVFHSLVIWDLQVSWKRLFLRPD